MFWERKQCLKSDADYQSSAWAQPVLLCFSIPVLVNNWLWLLLVFPLLFTAPSPWLSISSASLSSRKNGSHCSQSVVLAHTPCLRACVRSTSYSVLLCLFFWCVATHSRGLWLSSIIFSPWLSVSSTSSDASSPSIWYGGWIDSYLICFPLWCIPSCAARLVNWLRKERIGRL